MRRKELWDLVRKPLRSLAGRVHGWLTTDDDLADDWRDWVGIEDALGEPYCPGVEPFTTDEMVWRIDRYIADVGGTCRPITEAEKEQAVETELLELGWESRERLVDGVKVKHWHNDHWRP